MPTFARRLLAVLVCLAVGCAGLTVTAPTATAASPLDGYSSGNLVSDTVFYDGTRLDRAGVAAFIAARGASCVASPTGVPCLKDFRMNTPATSGSAHCAPIAARTGNTGAGIISDVAAACGINAEMLMVLIQRESTLLTLSGSSLTTTAYARATGANCPDYTHCDAGWANFFTQVYGAAEQFKKYRDPARSYRFRAGATVDIPYSPETLCGTARVTLANHATAGLYNYTPFASNKAALDAGPGEGDYCSTYGQRNFYWILKQWFPGSANTSTAAPVSPTPASTLTPQMTAIYDRMKALTLARVGASRSSITCADGQCVKRFTRLTMVWTPTRGATLSYADDPRLLPRYTDVPAGTLFEPEIEWLRAVRISAGWPDGSYRPLAPVGRDAMAAFLYRSAGSPAFTPPSRATFADVPTGNQFYKEIEWLAARGISTGWVEADGRRTFRPLQPVNRDAMAAFLYRAAGSPAYTLPATARFSDVPVGAQFRREIEWLASTGTTTGWPDRTYRPLNAVARDAMAAFLYRRAG